jgi:murein DD-endopeptidase MepM/ murein hydrolase activator NlpD
MVTIRHSGGYESSYLHLSSIAVRVGQHVSQGQLVGRVGSTGTATGAHLDYRLKKNGRYVNPLAEHRKLPPGEPIPAALRATFDAQRVQSAAHLARLTEPGVVVTVTAEAPRTSAPATHP